MRAAVRAKRWQGLAAASIVAIAPAAFAQQTPQGDVDDFETISVTASRVTRVEGFSAPTPTAVMSAEDVQRAAPLQVSDALLQIPTFRSTSPSSSANVYANLRSIGAQRTLLLVNGRRHVPTEADGTVDLNVIPASMVSRMEVVTGGASASWGSDAVAGVVNLILDDSLQGLRASVQGGISEYEDNEGFSASLAGGTDFADGRGYLIVGGEYAKSKGVRGLQPPHASRPWAGRGQAGNSNFATNGQPGVIYTGDVRRSDTSAGGLITAGPLRGIAFGPDGQPYQFGYGTVYGNTMIGGTDNYAETPIPGGDLRLPFERHSVMAHLNYQLTDSLKLFAEASYAQSISEGYGVPARNNGSLVAVNNCAATTLASALGSINVHIDNAFLPDSVRQQMLDAGVNCFAMGRTFRDPGMGEFRTEDGSPSIYRAVLGLEGDLAGDWTWDAYVQYGENDSQQMRKGNLHVDNFRRAINAVFDPSGNIVCADTLSADPAVREAAAGCQPFNLFGYGAPSPEAVAYVTGTSWLKTTTRQTVAALNFQGTLGSTWAGDIAVATGAEYRKEEVDAYVDPVSDANGWQTTNRKGIEGDYTAKEVYAEAIVPLAKDATLADQLDLSLAARYTDYSSSGGVTTWKVGLSWSITDEFRIRASQSRDIRAGNLGELFTPTAVAVTVLRHPLTADQLPAPVTTMGNRQLGPEEADTFTGGFVYEPNWFPGFSASVDYYSIDIDGQIGTLTGQQVLDQCYLANVQSYCDRITTDPVNGVVTGVTRQYENLDRFKTSGVDIEMAYRFQLPFLPGNFTLRSLANYVKELTTIVAIDSTITDPAGQYTQPHWTVFTTLGYQGERFNITAENRWFAGGKIDNTLTEGLIGSRGVNINHVGSWANTNLTLNYDLQPQIVSKASVFLRVNNVFDRWPPFPNTGTQPFDGIGREYRLGVRFSF